MVSGGGVAICAGISGNGNVDAGTMIYGSEGTVFAEDGAGSVGTGPGGGDGLYECLNAGAVVTYGQGPRTIHLNDPPNSVERSPRNCLN